ncbi:MAG: ornithine carbamoyltransferase [Gammaproteobacteria bacterium]|jgi:ornithine carbamoyltransferase|nr:ornithine carbamoyltransferase [Gammaproteobacteria bacterium]MBT3695233.1 ornithine carbamoyltransferase [Gammaproteobacteria bacterium]MBT5682156.1 ornithine carbamoyltransferase [Gammaproteobacteria bacterium]MBT6024606.1 ornithine carbamoyltransferase [Gammaproteobacteria bacterium]MBT6558580.1 ornithine carbamoyltransferase [Gammaproteobacteria bacterium]
MAKRDFLSLLDFTSDELKYVVNRAKAFRKMHAAGEVHQPLVGKTGALILQLSSTRTRVAFEAGFAQMGAHAIFLGSADTQIGRGEPIEDLARVLSEMVDIAMIRTLDQEAMERLAEYASIPVINAMSSLLHPCQLLADIQAFEEHRGSIEGKTVTFLGDGYNMCHSYINAAKQWGFNLRIACPDSHQPNTDILASCATAERVLDPREAVEGAHLVVTDVWSSMGHEGQEADRRGTFGPYQVNEALLDLADPEVLFMHCLPAHRGEEVSETLLDDPRSVVFHEAGNRLHTQKALVEFLLLGRQ